MTTHDEPLATYAARRVEETFGVTGLAAQLLGNAMARTVAATSGAPDAEAVEQFHAEAARTGAAFLDFIARLDSGKAQDLARRLDLYARLQHEEAEDED